MQQAFHRPFNRQRTAGDLLAQFIGHLVKNGVVHLMLFFQEAEQQQPVAEHVDAARNTLGVLVNGIEGLFGKAGVVLPANLLEAAFHIAAAFVGSEGAEVIVGDHALTQLLQVRVFQHLPELGLPQQKGLQQGLATHLQIGQHAQLFERARGQVLRLIDHQQCPLALPRPGQQEGLQSLQQASLVHALVAQAKGGGDHAQHFIGFELRGSEVGDDQMPLVHFLQQNLCQGGLAGAGITGDDHEAFSLAEPVAQVGQGPLVATAGVEKARVGAQAEGLGAQIVE